MENSRRNFFGMSSKACLSAAALSVMAGVPSLGYAKNFNPEKDVDILNVALSLEHEAINAYQLGASSGLLQKPILDVAILFQSHHKAHRDALVKTIETLGGKAVTERTLDDYAKALKANTLASQDDILKLAAKLELGAINAYLGVIPAFVDMKLSQIAGRLAADETMHYTALTQALGQRLPNQAFSFGG